MRVSPDPWHPDEPSIAQEAKHPHRSEWVRILLYAAVTFAIVMLFSIPNRFFTEWLMRDTPVLNQGRIMMVYSLAFNCLQPLAIMLVNRAVTFRSNRPLGSCIGLMLVAIIIVRAVLTVLNMLLAREGAEMIVRFAMVSSLAVQICYYVYQRVLIFRTTLDTRGTSSRG